MIEDAVVKVGVREGTEEPTIFRRLTYFQLGFLNQQGDPLCILQESALYVKFGGKLELQNLNPRDYLVSMTYMDSDGDIVLIDSEATLENALKEAVVGDGTLKIFARVTLKKKEEISANLSIETFLKDFLSIIDPTPEVSLAPKITTKC